MQTSMMERTVSSSTISKRRLRLLQLYAICQICFIIGFSIYFSFRRKDIQGLPHIDANSITVTEGPLRYQDYSVIDYSTNATQFESDCDTGHLWRIEPRTKVRQRPGYVNVDANIVFRRVHSSLSVACPRKLHRASFFLPRTALLAFPGCGSSWTRHLIQQLSGVQTSSEYHEEKLLPIEYTPDGKVKRVIAVKTHGPSNQRYNNTYSYRYRYDRIILILRDPYKAFIANYKRSVLGLGHTGNATINPESKRWYDFISKYLSAWREFMKSAVKSGLPTLVIFYEDMVSNLIMQLLEISYFLSSENLTDFALCCTVKMREGFFHRKPSQEEVIELFPKEQIQNINQAIEEIADFIGDSMPKVAKRLYDYIFQ